MSGSAVQDLERVIELAGRFEACPPEPQVGTVLHEARELVERTGRRRGLAPGCTVVALLGATGSGKSSLFNALTGTRAATTSVIRPTTSEPLAAVGRPDGPDTDPTELLDWLGVGNRLEISDGSLGPGTVVLDLPDIDSDRPEHRRRAESMAGAVDVLVWVLDPEKYADGVVHHDFLEPLATHDAVMLVVLNQLDRLGAAEREAVLADLRRLLDAEGLGGTELVALSARTGQGVDALAARLAALAAAGRAAEARLAADRRRLARDLRQVLEVGGSPQASTGRRSDELGEAAARAAGVDQVEHAVRQSAELAAMRRVGWLPLRWVARLCSDPLRRLHLGMARPAGQDPTSPVPPTSMAPPGPVAVGALRVAAHRAALAMTAGTPERIRTEMVARTRARAEALAPALDEAVGRTDLEATGEPRWWGALDLLQRLLALAAVVGGLWQTVLVLARSHLLIEVDPPRWGGVPWPVILLLGSLAAGLLLAALSSWPARAGARRRAARVGRRLRAGTDAVVERELYEPLRADLADWRELVGLLTVLEHR
ncbi:MAG: 50S ribosome-binding GTPase [Actinomyces sp.]|uniref:GTPase n=1 Tax=Actinomyces sp. TaxID=29317 RepID=UPI0026DD42FC|nr:GTPase [Actinomyces sp.]MDO4244326.1 50S ribosome-binding GTPase [Actinomyces sp.]